MTPQQQCIDQALIDSKRIIMQNVVHLFNDLFNDHTHDYALTPVEGEGIELRRKLDLSCGIDYVMEIYNKKDKPSNKLHNAVMYAVSSRVQYTRDGWEPFNSFTVRNKRESGLKTEYEKLCEAIKHDSLRPTLSMHIFCNKRTGDILSMGIARTSDIIRFINEGRAVTKETGNKQVGQSEFWAVPWDQFINYTDKIYIYKNY